MPHALKIFIPLIMIVGVELNADQDLKANYDECSSGEESSCKTLSKNCTKDTPSVCHQLAEALMNQGDLGRSQSYYKASCDWGYKKSCPLTKDDNIEEGETSAVTLTESTDKKLNVSKTQLQTTTKKCKMGQNEDCYKLKRYCYSDLAAACYEIATVLSSQDDEESSQSFYKLGCKNGHTRSCSAIRDEPHHYSSKKIESNLSEPTPDHNSYIQNRQLQLEEERLELQRRQVELMENAERSRRMYRLYNMTNQLFNEERYPSANSYNCKTVPQYDLWGNVISYATNCQ